MRRICSSAAAVLLSSLLLQPVQASYSPDLKANHPSQLLWGDTHLHTSWSADAFAFGNTLLGPEDAFRFAKGETITSSSGLPARLTRPLDFLVVADHAEYLGVMANIAANTPQVVDTDVGKRWQGYLQKGALARLFSEYRRAVLGKNTTAFPPKATRYIWQQLATTADRMNQPGVFTAFSGYEWSSMPNDKNLHRVVIYKDDASKVTQTLPFSAIDSPDPEDLWASFERYTQKTGGDVLAIPHNGNLSQGLMFAHRKLNGDAIDKRYAEQRAYWEPLYEVTQVKGDGETHPLLSPDDSFADYETWSQVDADNFQRNEKTRENLRVEYARAALRSGLALQQSIGVNPFKFGLQGATDSHTSLATAEENNFFGKFPESEPNPKRLSNRMGEGDKLEIETPENWRLAASGYTAVWAEKNTRESIFAAMRRKEVYATTGSRIQLRYFAGWEFTNEDITSPNAVTLGYQKGVPMGADLMAKNKAASPTFMVMAAKDPEGANLERVQIIKGWLDDAGNTHEKIYDAAVSDKRANQHTVDLTQPGWKNTIGSPVLSVLWTDPDFNPTQPAFYYVRVIEIPTPRWTAYDRAYFNVETKPEIPLIHQERAYGSPIWYTPSLTGHQTK